MESLTYSVYPDTPLVYQDIHCKSDFPLVYQDIHCKSDFPYTSLNWLTVI